MLFGRQRASGHIGTRDLGEVERESAPARADVQDLMARLEQQLGGEVALLAVLRLFQRVVVAHVVCARILAVVVEEHVVQCVRQVVVMGHVSLRLAFGIALGVASGKPPRLSPQALHPMIARPLIHPAQFEKIVDVAVLDGEAAVHEGFAERDLRVEEQAQLGGAVVHAHGDGGTRIASLEDRSLAVAAVNGEFTNPDHAVEQPSQNHRVTK